MAKFLKRPLAVLLCLLTLMSLFAVAVPTMASSTPDPKGTNTKTTGSPVTVNMTIDRVTSKNYRSQTVGTATYSGQEREGSAWTLNNKLAVCCAADLSGVANGVSYSMIRNTLTRDCNTAKAYFYLIPKLDKNGNSLRGNYEATDFFTAGFWKTPTDAVKRAAANAFGSSYSQNGNRADNPNFYHSYYRIIEAALAKQGYNIRTQGPSGMGETDKIYYNCYYFGHYVVSTMFAQDTPNKIKNNNVWNTAVKNVANFIANNNAIIPDVPDRVTIYYYKLNHKDSTNQSYGITSGSVNTFQSFMTSTDEPVAKINIVKKPHSKVNNYVGYNVNGAGFTIYSTFADAVADKNRRGTYDFADNSSSQSHMYYVPSDKPTTWYIKETRAPMNGNGGYLPYIDSVYGEGITANAVNSNIFSVTINPMAAGTAYVTDVPDHGKLKIIKKDANNKKPLPNATFKIASDSSFAANTILATVTTTGTEGSVTVENKEFYFGRKLWVKETKAPEGYTLNNTVKTVTITKDDDNTVEVEFENNPDTLSGSIVIKKKPKPNCEGFIKNNPNYTLEGAKFAIYEDKDSESVDPKKSSDITSNTQRYEKLWDVETDGNGVAKLDVDNISLGSVYYAIETKAPDGFLISDEVKKFEFNSQADFENEAKSTGLFYDSAVGDPVSVAVTKKGSDGMLPLEGAYFRLDYYTEVTDGNTVPDADPIYSWVIASDSEGEAIFNNAHLNTSLSETKTIPAEFLPYGENGVAELPIGTLVVKEVKAPNNYLLDETEHVIHLTGKSEYHGITSENKEIEPIEIIDKPIPNINYSIKKLWNDNNNNDGKRPTAIDIKVRAFSDEMVPGIDSEGNNTYIPKELQSITSDDATYSFPMNISLTEAGNWINSLILPEGYYGNDGIYHKYTLSFEEPEIKGYFPKAGYDEPEIVKISDTEYAVTFENTHNPETTEFGLEKRWDDNKDSASLRPTTAKFELYVNTEGAQVLERDCAPWFELSSTKKVTVDELGTPIGNDADGNPTNDGIITLSKKNNWRRLVVTLPKYKDGKQLIYFAKEINVDPNYSILKTIKFNNVVKDVIDVHGGATYSTYWYDYNQGAMQYNTMMYFTYTNHLKTGKFTLFKTDADDNALDGVSFEIHKIEKDDKDAIISDKAISAVYKDDDEKYRYTGMDSDATSFITNEEGTFLVDNLPIGDYYVVETGTKSGYMPFDGKIEFSIKENNQVVEKNLSAEKTFVNHKVVLPETGGIGDNWIYGIGVIALTGVVALTIILIVRKINKKEKKNHV